MKLKASLLFVCLTVAALGADLKPAPAIALKDASGKTVTLEHYRGKVVLLDFWATWCTGCKEEMPWFVEFQKKYGTRKFAVVGVAMDEEGWKVVKPFLAQHREFSYNMLAGDDATAKSYGSAKELPDSFLIDKKGRLVESYRGKVDRQAVDARIAALLNGR